MALNVPQLTTTMLNAGLGVLALRTPDVRAFAEREFGRLAEAMARSADLVAAGEMEPDAAALHLEVQQGASRAVLATVPGLGASAAQEAVNAAVSAVRPDVNADLPFRLV